MLTGKASTCQRKCIVLEQLWPREGVKEWERGWRKREKNIQKGENNSNIIQGSRELKGDLLSYGIAI